MHGCFFAMKFLKSHLDQPSRILPDIQWLDSLPSLLLRPVYYDYARPAASTAATLAGSAVSGIC